jgi:hypothetical protein
MISGQQKQAWVISVCACWILLHPIRNHPQPPSAAIISGNHQRRTHQTSSIRWALWSSDSIRLNQTQSDSIRLNQKQSEAIRLNQKQSDLIDP